MAKIVNTVTFKNAYISLEDNSIIEVTKETENRYNLAEVFNRFKDVSVSFTIKEDSELDVKTYTDDSTDVTNEPLRDVYVEHEVVQEEDE